MLAAAALFDEAPDPEVVRRFLAEPTHHLLMAYDQAGAPVGFASGVEMTHPDKGTEMFLYELAVDEQARQQGVGRALTEALSALAQARGCYAMWTATEPENLAARRTYEAAGGRATAPQVIVEWSFDDARRA